MMKWIYLWYLRIRYFNRVIEVIGKKQFKELDEINMSSPLGRSICVYSSIPNRQGTYKTKFIWKD